MVKGVCSVTCNHVTGSSFVTCLSFQDYVKHPLQPVLVVSYEMFVRNFELISSVNFDLIVCDEGHRLKNTNIKTTSVSIRSN